MQDDTAQPDPDDLPDLSPEEYRRYGRHLTLPEVGEDGQRRLKASSALVIGAGGLGSPVALYLTAAGVGRITLADFDVVDASNLQRQVLFDVASLGRRKVDAAAERLRGLNPGVAIEPVPARIGQDNVMALVRASDVVIDGSDNFVTRYLVSDACVLTGTPYVYAAIHRFEGQASVFHPPAGPCYRCLFPEPPPDSQVPNCAQAGVLGVLPGLLGSIQASEAIKVLLGIGEPLLGRLLLVDALSASFRAVKLGRDPACPACGDSPTITEAVEGGGPACIDSAGRATAPVVTASELRDLLAGDTPPLLVDVREAWEWKAGALPDSINIPLGDVQLRLDEIPADRDVVAYCRVGPRGDRAAEMMRTAGIHGARNLADGLLAWRDEIDASQTVA